MKKLVIAVAALSMITLAGCTEEIADANPVVNASEYVSEESEYLGDLGESKESQLSDAENVLNDLQ